MTPQRRVLFLSKASDDASTRYRALQFIPQFAAAGWLAEHAVMPNTLAGWIALRATIERSDVVVVLRKLLPDPMCWLLRKLSRRLVFDFDDAVFCRDTGEASPGRMRRFRAITRRADAVWCGNDYLADTVRQGRDDRSADPVTVIPTAIDPRRYRASNLRAGDVALVWIGSSSTRRYVESLLPMLDQLAGEHENIRLRVIADFSIESNRIPIECVPWTSHTEADELAHCHIGLAPLNDDAWTRGKCGCKVLQYMASGLPVVSSDMQAHRRLLGDDCGLFAVTATKWMTALSSLIESRELRERMGRAAVNRVSEQFSIEAVFPRMLGTLESLAYRRKSA
jgi:glycosyltransferase involved in cell wall biosynthesis